MKKILNTTRSKAGLDVIPYTPHRMVVEVEFTNGTMRSFAGVVAQCDGKVTIVSKEEFIVVPLENILYYRMKEIEET